MNTLTAVFIEPEGSLLEALQDRKTWLERRMPGQFFCSHPPHCTVLVGNYGSPEAWRTFLKDRLSHIAPFTLRTENWHVFADDPLTGGGQTVALRVVASPALFDLQLAIAESAQPFVQDHGLNHPLGGHEPFGRSLRQFGFPFVGPHWIPHLTVGSPRVPALDPLVQELTDYPAVHEFPVRAVSTWRVCGDTHVRLDEFPLAGPR